MVDSVEKHLDQEGKYNGWSNYATWRVALEFFDGVSLSGNNGWFTP